MAVRLKDIAEDLGISTVTVSKVLRGNPEISAATRERVLQRMRELNYKPNMLARGLASGRTYTVGLVVPDLVHPFFAEFAKGAASVLRGQGLALLIASAEDDPELERSEIQTLLSRDVDVLLVASSQPKWQDAGEAQTPLLLVDREAALPTASFVGTDDHMAGCLATSHLLEIGRRRLAHIGGGNLSPSVERLRGFRETLQAAGVPVAEDHLVSLERFEEGGDEAGLQAMRFLLGLEQRPDAVFCYNDLTAIGAMEAVYAAGLRVPEDVAVIGCGNLRYNRHLRTPLSSIDQQPEQLGRRAAELALELAANPGRSPEKILLEPQLVARASTVGS